MLIKSINSFLNIKVDGEKHGMNLVGNAENGGGGGNVSGKNNRIVHDSLRFAQRSSNKPAAVVVQQVLTAYLPIAYLLIYRMSHLEFG